jgi:hypothetical protein
LVVAEQVEQTTRDYLVATATIRCSAASRQLVAAVAVDATAEAIWLAKTAARAVAVHSPKLVALVQSAKAITVVRVMQAKKQVAAVAVPAVPVARAATPTVAHRVQVAHQALLVHL